MFKSRRLGFALTVTLLLSAAITWAAFSLTSSVNIIYSDNHVPTIRAATELEAIYTQGYLHARDRFFQMDVQRHLFSGRLAEMVGPAALAQDVQLRTLGLRRAAERSLAVQTPEVIAWLEAYADGVNAFLQNGVFGEEDDEFCTSDDLDESSDSSSGSSGSSGTASSQLAHNLPPEYGALEIDRHGIEPWTPLDSLTMVKGLAFGLSFDLEDIDRTIALLTFLEVGPLFGINGLQLFGADLYMTVPFDPGISIPASSSAPPVIVEDPGSSQGNSHYAANSARTSAPPTGESPEVPGVDYSAGYLQTPGLLDMLQGYRAAAQASPAVANAFDQDFTKKGSNWFIASGANTESGFPMMANDPHLALGTPATFYEVHLQVKNGINVTGASFPGAPGVVIGCTDIYCWGATVNPLDVTDVYQEVLLALGPDPTQPTHSFFEGAPEPLQFIPQQFLFNAIGDTVPNTLVDAGLPPSQGGVTIVVPRRNNGPIVQVNVDPGSPTPITGISVMYTGWSGTQELEAFRQFARAGSPDEFKDALQFFDVGSQNWAYADINGNIAYFTSAELPIREDLQTIFFPDALQPPYLIRDGTHTRRHEWLPLTNPQPNQAIAWEILPFNEMPQVVNPPSGIILNANNDPIGTSLDNVPYNQFRAGFNGLLYLSPGYAPGFRMGRITRLVDEALSGGGKLSVQDFKDFQANNELLDAEFFTPYLVEAMANASAGGAAANLQALAADPELVEAVQRLEAWDFSTPTGLVDGYDPFDQLPLGAAPSGAEIDASVAATIYAVWRGQLVQRVVDGTLASLPLPLNSLAPGSNQAVIAVQRLLLAYPIRGGFGLGLVNFFNEPDGATPGDRRDLILLRALRSALDLLASPDFAPAFAGSTNQDDYRWGKLHRIVLAHPLGGPFNVPPTGGPGNLGPGLAGFARAGGMGAVDASSHSARADGLDEFMFASGPSRRFISVLTPEGPESLEVLPGGQSGVPGNPFSTDQLLTLWLVNDYHGLPQSFNDVNAGATVCQKLVPPPAPSWTLPGDDGPGQIDTGPGSNESKPKQLQDFSLQN